MPKFVRKDLVQAGNVAYLIRVAAALGVVLRGAPYLHLRL